MKNIELIQKILKFPMEMEVMILTEVVIIHAKDQ
jgi:hypothetical protein